MLTTFLTIVSSIWLFFYVLVLGSVFYDFYKLTPIQQKYSTINISGVTTIGALLSFAWLITMWLS